jgi:hypothetical protein
MKCPDLGSTEYCEALRVANGGHQPPLLNLADETAAWALKLDEIKAHRNKMLQDQQANKSDN